MNYDFKDKVVLITGASGGIGKGLSERFADSQSTIIFTSSKNPFN